MVYWNVDTLLQQKGQTRYWLAKEMGSDYNTVNRIVRNQSHSVHLNTIDKLRAALDCTYADLFRDHP